MEEQPAEAMETDSADALDDILKTAHILADAMDSSNSKPDSESTGKSEAVARLAAVTKIEEKTKKEPLTKEPEVAEKNTEIDPKVAEAIGEIEDGGKPKEEKVIENSETQPAKESPKPVPQVLAVVPMNTTAIQSKIDSLEGVKEEPEAAEIDQTIDTPKEEKDVVVKDEKEEESAETEIDPAPMVQDVETGEFIPKEETTNIQDRLKSESNDLSEADLTEVPMEIEPPHISEKPPSPLPPPPIQIPDDLKCDSIVTPLKIKADTTDKTIAPPVPIDEIQPQSPRIIELLDDDDEDMSLPTKTLHATKRQAPHESVNDLPACKKDSKSNSPVNLPVVVVVENNDDDDDDSKHIYYEKDCVNYECKRQNKRFVKVPLFILNFYKIPRKTNKTQFVCDDCYDRAVEKYEDLAASLQAQLPLLEQDIPKRQDFVEILDSSDEDDEKDSGKLKDEPEFEKETISMLQKELDDTICDILSRVEIKSQVNWSKSILKNKLKKLEADSLEITNSLKKLQKSADKMHTSLYQCPKIKIKELQPLDLNTGRPFISETEYTIPPLGELKFAPIVVNAIYYAVRNKAIASWLPCRVIELMDVVISGQKAVKYYKVKYVRIKIPTIKCVSAKHMAYGDPPNVRLSIGARVIALFDGSTLSRSKESVARSAFYPGIVAEQLQAYNKYRYLIFFDDGYAQYVHHKDVRVVCQAAENVWEDVHPASREFIHNYLSQYQKHRPMVQVKKGQSMITESNGKWLYAKVVDIDASLVQMHFDGQNRSEWIYRGSTRLGPLFREKQTNRNAPVSQLPRRSEPYVRYMQDDDTANRNDIPALATDKQAGRAVAKKSTAKQDSQTSPAVPVKHLNNSTIFLEDDNRPKGKVVYYTAKKNMPPKLFITHQCSPDCLFAITHNLSSYSPLAKPLLSGWERQIFKSKLKKSVVYRGPCGRRIRNMEELHKYLRLTKNILNVDNFDFDCVIHCLAEYVIESSIVQMPDLSGGLENMIIPCINYYDNTMPPECEYSAERIPTEGVNLNLDPSFLVGCDCEDDCADKSKCSCWQLTLSGARFGNPNTPPENVGYSYKRLPDPVPTGIYECNLNCKCSKSCLNRVVQHPLQMKLQVFKTSNRGWGLRCLNDVPKGSFICIYAGHLLTEQKANEGGANAGDEYFAELDYIEVVERLKEGYESDVQEENESEDEEYEEPNPDADSDEDFRSSAAINKNASINTRLRARKSTRDYSEDEKGTKANTENGEEEEDSDKHDQERQVISFVPNTSLGNEESTTNTKYRSIRKYFGKNEFCYIMDAKTTGNIGRYFNHSCSPNLFVQNVFVDTQDLRFPWVAFFALSHIRAGTELTWNYNYEVGIVPGKVLYCECGAPNCRGRLL